MSSAETKSARLRQARIAAGFESAAAAAERFGWKYPTYAQHESGRGLGKDAARYAKAFKVSEAWLLTGAGGGFTEQEVELNSIYQALPTEFRERLLEDARILRRAAGNPSPAEATPPTSGRPARR